jgi:nucleoside-diphosphate-sugar epimerase
VTHVFYTARAKHGETGVESVEDNVAMLRNVIDAIEPVATGLEHIHLVQGTKYYGMHLGPFQTPAREDDPRPDFPNFYYDQQDLLAERSSGRPWAWSASRPTFIYDFAPERARNGVAVIGAYAALCRELGVPFDFPGSRASFDAQRDLTDASLLARAMKFIAVTPDCCNEAYNVTNGDVVSWRALWPRIASYFGIAAGEVRPFRMHEWSRDKQPVWDRIVRKYGLAPTSLDDVADWAFADFHWAQEYDVVSDPSKLLKAGFPETMDSGDMLVAHLQRYRQAKILP